jgi:uncharacterized damage-inducible protein DinB
MANPIIEQYFRQNLWANLAILDVLEPLGDRAKELIVDGVFADAYTTMVHVIASETGYLAQIKEAGEPIAWTRGERPGWDRLRDLAHQTGARFQQVAQALDGDPIQRGVYRDEPYVMRTSLLLLQAYNHGVDHRSQVKTILSVHGIDFPELDGWTWSLSPDGQASLGATPEAKGAST